MKNNYYLSILITLFTISISTAQFTAISDANFEQALVDLGIDNVMDGQVLNVQAQLIESLDISNNDISNLSGIEAFSNLLFLDASGNNVVSIDLSQNVFLEHLEIRNNQLLTLDVSENTALNDLKCSDNNLTALELSANTNLETLFCTSNAITNLDLPSSLKTLFCYNNLLENLDIDHCTALEVLDSNTNLLTQIDVQDNLNLEVLFLESNLLNELDVSNNSALISLNASRNSISEIFLENCPQLEKLRFYENTLDAIDVSNNHNLEILSIRSNNLTTIDVSQNEVLEYLLINLNLYLGEELDLSNNLNLISLNAADTNISCIKVLDEVAATNSEGLYTNWLKPLSATYTESACNLLDIENFIDTDDLNIYPNPTSDYVNISISNSAFENTINTIKVINITGKIVYNSNNYTEKINVKSLAKGMYILQIHSTLFATESKKIIVK